MMTRLLVIFLIGLYKVEGGVVHEEPAPCDLTLQKDGNIVEDGETVMELPGDLNQVYCKALCSGPGPTPALRWSKQDGTRIPMFRNRVYQVEIPFDRTNILTIRTMLYIDQGNYTCRGWLRHSGWVSKTLNIQYGCPQLYHMCDTSRCISNKHVCDGKADCRDETDEKNCESCFPGQFACDGGCKDGSVRCDGYYDCVDSSDEYMCGCEPEFTCPSGGCVAKDKVCDGNSDCWDGEDERNCTYCNEDQFHCGDVECVPQTSVCNGAKDCSNGMDENECPFKVLMVDTLLEMTEGMLAAFECYVSPFSDQRNYEITWSRQDGDLPATGEISGVVGRSVLSMQKVTISDAGTYVCEVTDGKTTESVIGELIVTERCPDSFECSNGTCIPVIYQCDGFVDCGLGEDEENCDADCQAGEFDCGDGECIPEEQKCDSFNQCVSGADEADCCANGFLCWDDECIDDGSVCDGIADCKLGEDENNCKKCFPGQFACDDGCKDGSVRCDGYYDCVDSSDEYMCGCEPEFTCSSGGCVAKDKLCDGNSDCWDGEDERNCTYCDEDQFHCGDAQCVPQTSVCNGAKDCSNGMDENECPFKVLMVDTRLEMTEGMLAAFECYVSPFLDQRNYEITWSRQDGELPATSDIIGVVGRSVLTIQQVTISDAGTYVCEVTDGKTTESVIGELIVTERCPDSFECLNGTCIPVTYQCDGFVDCGLGEDEENCDAECQAGEFDCGDGECIPKEQKCDGLNQCVSGADEADCCGFLCWDGECIDDGSVCDGFLDCKLGEDENTCKSCFPGQFACDGGCKDGSVRCDGYYDCVDSSDEYMCAQ